MLKMKHTGECFWVWPSKWRNRDAVVNASQILSCLASVFWLNIRTVSLLSISSADASKGNCHFSSRYESCMRTRLFFEFCSLQQRDSDVRTDKSHTGTYSTNFRRVLNRVCTRAHIRTAGFLRQCFEKLTRTRRQKLPGDLESEQHRQLILMFVHSLCIEMRTGNICKCWQWNRESLSTGPSGYTDWIYLMLYHN